MRHGRDGHRYPATDGNTSRSGRGKDGHIALDTSPASDDANDLASREMALSCVAHLFRDGDTDEMVNLFAQLRLS